MSVLFVAFLIVTLSRSIGFLNAPTSLVLLAMQSFLVVIVALPIQTTAALVAVRYSRKQISLRIATLTGCIIGAVPSTAIAMTLIWIVGLGPEEGGATRYDLLNWLRMTYPLAFALHATLGSMLWMVLSFPWWKNHLEEHQRPEPQLDLSTLKSAPPKVTTATPQVPSFMARLSPQHAGTLWALSSERHYVRVTTDRGTELVLMRLSDAIEQCRHLDGLRIHRSHWVHRLGVHRVVRRNGRLFVDIANGESLPVSRAHQSAVINFADGDVSSS